MTQIKIVALILLLGSGTMLSGQNVSSHYFLDNLPESNKLNPAFEPNCKFYLDLPGIGNSYFGFNSDIGFQDVVTMGNDGSTLKLPFNSPELWSQFQGTLNTLSFVESELNVNVIGFGFKFNRGYFHFNVSDRASIGMRLPSDIMDLNDLGQRVSHNFSDFAIKTSVFREYAAGISMDINSDLTVGGKVKLLQGLGNLDVEFKQASLYTSTEIWQTDGDIRGRTSSPVKYLEDENGDISEADADALEETEDILQAYLYNFSNLGLAIDLGVEYMVLPNVSLSASIVDFGRINWKSNATNVVLDGAGEFRGLDDEPVFTGDDSDERIDEFFTEFGDSLTDQFDLSHTYNGYSTNLVPKLFIGGEYQVSPVFSAGLLSKTRFYKAGLRENVYVSANLNLYHFLTAGAHYNWAWSEPNTLGFTVAVKLCPVQIYFSTDMMPAHFRKYVVDGSEMGVPLPSKFNGINAQVGVNLLFGCRKKKNEPLYRLLGD